MATDRVEHNAVKWSTTKLLIQNCWHVQSQQSVENKHQKDLGLISLFIWGSMASGDG